MWRIVRAGAGLSLSWITPADSVGRAGNRFDVPGGGVLYACTDVAGWFYETLARFRVHDSVGLGAAARAAAKDHDHMQPGQVPRQWREARAKFEITVQDPLPFLDVEHEETRAFLAAELAEGLAEHEALELDVADVRGGNRLLTRRLALWAYTRTDDSGQYAYSGIRYLSRHGDHECWAIFDSTPIEVRRQTPITLDDTDLDHVAQLWGLRPH